MARATKAQQAEQAEAIERLRDWIKPGDTVYTILRHRAASGMSRVIDHVVIEIDAGVPKVHHIGWNVAKAIGLTYDRDRDGIKVSGTGMDMGFSLVYDLGRVMFPDGFECTGHGCPANDHSNGDRDYTPHQHREGGYALRQRWL